MPLEPENPAAFEPTLKSSGNHEPTVEEIQRLMATPQPDPLVGTKLAGGRYEILEVLGSGGMSVVYKARQELVDRIVAVKTLKVQLLNDPSLILRFDREVKTLSRLNHPNIVTVYDCVISESGQPYFIMDYLQGQTLQEVIAAQGRLPLKRARDIFMQICAAVDHAHKQGVVHRDLKPANIMLVDLSTQEHVKVVDFGLAKLGEQSQRLTQTGELWGSPLYMSPEQCSGYSLDARSDIYSLGTVMYETLTGKVPFRGNTFLETINKQMHEPPAHFNEIDAALSIPHEVEEVVFKAMAKKPENRFESMSELRTAIQNSFPAGRETSLLESPSPAALAKVANAVVQAKPTVEANPAPIPAVDVPQSKTTEKAGPAGKATKSASKAPLVLLAVLAMLLALGTAGIGYYWLSVSQNKPAPTAATPTTPTAPPAAPLATTAPSTTPAKLTATTAPTVPPTPTAPTAPSTAPTAPTANTTPSTAPTLPAVTTKQTAVPTKPAHTVASTKISAAKNSPSKTSAPKSPYHPEFHKGKDVFGNDQSADDVKHGETWDTITEH